jgi:hypothetical protein
MISVSVLVELPDDPPAHLLSAEINAHAAA